MSAESYDWLRASARRSHRTDDDADVVIDAVERAEMDVEHKPLDAMLRQRRKVELPDLQPGMVIRYEYLWAHEAVPAPDQGNTRQTCSAATIRSLPPEANCGCRMTMSMSRPSEVNKRSRR